MPFKKTLIVWRRTGKEHREDTDMDDLGQAIDIGLAPPEQVARILRHTKTLIKTIQSGNFPPPEIHPCREELSKQGLVP
jgi:predicted RNA-binding protein associated with RNAse of E/G family